MSQTEDQRKMINSYLVSTFYYLYANYPSPHEPYWWNNRNDKLAHMDDMSLDHLNASAKLVQKNIDDLLNNLPSFKKETKEILRETILIPAQKKLSELKEIIQMKINSDWC